MHEDLQLLAGLLVPIAWFREHDGGMRGALKPFRGQEWPGA